MAKKKKEKKDWIQKLIENKLVQLLGILAIAYFLLQLVGVNLGTLNIVFQFIIIVFLVSFGIASFSNYLDKKIKNVRNILKDIKGIKSIRKDINKIKKQQKIDRDHILSIKKHYENLLYRYDLRIKKLEKRVPHRRKTLDRESYIMGWGRR